MACFYSNILSASAFSSISLVHNHQKDILIRCAGNHRHVWCNVLLFLNSSSIFTRYYLDYVHYICFKCCIFAVPYESVLLSAPFELTSSVRLNVLNMKQSEYKLNYNSSMYYTIPSKWCSLSRATSITHRSAAHLIYSIINQTSTLKYTRKSHGITFQFWWNARTNWLPPPPPLLLAALFFFVLRFTICIFNGR